MVFGIGNFSPVSLLATAALGPAGGIVGQLATLLFSQVGQQMIQQMGQRLGVPQSQIDFVQSAFANQHGDYQGGALNIDEAVSALGRETNASPADIGRAQGDVQETLNRVLDDLSQGEDVKDARAGGRGKGWLMALAQVLGAKMDRLADDMGSMAREISDGAASKSSEFTVLAQEFGLVMNAATTSIKTIGEAMNNMARKQ